jgi:hypothetical protein
MTNPVSFPALPDYPYPAPIEKGMLRAGNAIIADWSARLDILTTADESIAPSERALIGGYARWLIDMHLGLEMCPTLDVHPKFKRWSWAVIVDPAMPGDAYTDYIKVPTAIALATLVTIKHRLPTLAAEIGRLERAITRTSRQIHRRTGYRGSGYDAMSDTARLLSILAKGGVIREWYSNPDEYGELCEELTKLRQEMTSQPESWISYEKAGFSRISVAELQQIVTSLDPFEELPELDWEEFLRISAETPRDDRPAGRWELSSR